MTPLWLFIEIFLVQNTQKTDPFNTEQKTCNHSHCMLLTVLVCKERFLLIQLKV